MLPPPFRLAYLLPNPHPQGTDYVVGDIHGRFDRLQLRLDRLGFDPTRDRLVAVGDLLDRHAGSRDALTWLDYPWFYSLLGNHEVMYLAWRKLRHHPEAQRTYEATYFLPGNGGLWVKNHDEAFHAALETRLQQLPTIYVLPTAGLPVLAVHAELPDGAAWPALSGEAWPPERCDGLVWGRLRIKSRERPGQFRDAHRIPGVSAVVVGHTPVRQPVVLGSMLYLDTCGWLDEHPQARFTVLSVAEVQARVAAGTPAA
jgi:serine/threonine protein phosphatase 1